MCSSRPKTPKQPAPPPPPPPPPEKTATAPAFRPSVERAQVRAGRLGTAALRISSPSVNVG